MDGSWEGGGGQDWLYVTVSISGGSCLTLAGLNF